MFCAFDRTAPILFLAVGGSARCCRRMTNGMRSRPSSVCSRKYAPDLRHRYRQRADELVVGSVLMMELQHERDTLQKYHRQPIRSNGPKKFKGRTRSIDGTTDRYIAGDA